MLYPLAEAYSGHSQAFKLDLSAKTVNGFKLRLLIFAKSPVADAGYALNKPLTSLINYPMLPNPLVNKSVLTSSNM